MGKQGLKKVKQNIVDSMELPKDLMYGSVIVTVTGNGEALIENYRGILEFNGERIRIQTKHCRVELRGKHLLIEYYTNDEMKIKGFIQEIVYET